MRNITLLFFLMSFITTMKAQVTGYVFTHSVGTYVPVSATATRLTAIEADDAISASTNIGFNFVYEGSPYTTFKASSNGFISFGTGTGSLSTNNLSTSNADSRPIVAPLWDDLDGRSTEGSFAGYELTGTAPNRVLTMEWRNWEWNYGSTAAVISFQVKLYETTNVVEFVYRPEAGNINSGSATIGIGGKMGSGNGSFLNLTSIAAPAVSGTNSVTDLNAKPVAGQIYKFTPPACYGPLQIEVTGITTSSLVLNWTAVDIQRAGQYEVRTSGAPGSGATGLIASGNTAAGDTSKLISGLADDTSYTVYFRMACGTSFSVWLDVAIRSAIIGQIGSGVQTTDQLPIYTLYGYNYSQQIYLASELTAAIGTNQLITKIKLHFKSTSATANYKDWKIYMGNTTQAAFANTTSWVPGNQLTAVFDGVVNFPDPTDDWMEISLNSAFVWDGVSNIVIAVSEVTPLYTSGATFRKMDTPTNRGILYREDGAPINVSSPPTATSVLKLVPQIILEGEPLPACMYPLNIQASDLTSNSVKYTWNIMGTAPYVSVDYFLSTDPTPPDDDAEATGTLDAPATQLILSDLNENTRYYIWLRLNCTTTVKSVWADMKTFKTNSLGQIGTGELVTTSLPIQSNYNYNFSQQIYLASEVATAVGTSRYIKKIKFHFSSVSATENYKDWKIFMGNTTKGSFGGLTATEWVPVAGMTTVFDGVVTFPNPTGDWIEITLAEPFLWDGTSNVVVGVQEYTDGNTSGASFRRMDTGSTYRGLLYRVDGAASVLNLNALPAASARYQYVPQIVLLGEVAPNCLGVSSSSYSDLTMNSVKVNWVNNATVLATEYFYATTLAQAPTAATAPMGSVNAPGLFADITGLTADTQYYVWFRNKCSATETSAWSGLPLSFKTPMRGLIGGGADTTDRLPIYSYNAYNYSQQIYLASEIRASLAGTGQQYITKLKFHINGVGTIANYKDWKILLGNTTKADFTGTTADQWVPITVMQEVFDGELTFPNPTNDWMEITLTEPFAWDGISNIVVAVHEYTPSYTTAAIFRKMDTPTNRGLLHTLDGTLQNIANPPAATNVYKFVPQIVFETAAMPSCLKPANVRLEGVGKNAATLNWSAPINIPALGYEYEVRTSGAAGSGTVGRVLTGTVANTVLTQLLSGLTPSTEYFVYVRSRCTATNNSDWTVVKKFTTMCNYTDFTVQNAAICGQGIVTLSITVTGTTGTFKWYDVATGGVVLFEGPAFTTPLLTANKSYWVQGTTGTGNDLCLSERKKVDVVVSAAPAFTLSKAALTICEGQSSEVVTVTSDASIYNTYTWSPATGVSGNAQTGWVFNPAVSTEYTLMAKQTAGDLCEVIRTVEVTVNTLPVVSVTPDQDELILCQDDVKEFTVESVGGDDYYTIGAGTLLTSAASTESAFQNYRANGKSQLLFTAAELRANGISAGPLKSVSFNINSLGDSARNDDYTVKIAPTTLSSFATANFLTTEFTTVYGPATYTHTASGWQEIVFTTPFVWDGSSNLILEIYHKGADMYASSTTYYTATTDNMLLYSGTTSATANLSKRRYNVKFKAKADYQITWSPATNLFTDEDTTVPYVLGEAANKIFYKAQTEGLEDLIMTASSGNGCPLVRTFNIRTVVITDADALDQEFCGAVPVSELVATGQEGASFNWYRQATGGLPLSPTTLLVTGTYYVTQIIGTCESTTRQAIHVDIKNKPLTPISANRNICGTAMLSDLDVTYDAANTLNWYDANQDLIVGDVALQTGIYFVSQSNNVCESDRLRVSISVNPVPGAPTATASQTFCGTARVSNLAIQLAAGTVAKWYSSMTATTALSPNDFLSTGTYYGAQVSNGCESTRVAVTVVVYDEVALPIAQNQNFCTNNVTVSDLLVTALPGARVNWYNTATGGTALGANQPLTSGLYYVSQKIGDCESARVRIGVNIVNNNTAPNALPQSFCGATKVSNLHVNVATGMIVKWYAQEQGGTALANDAAIQTGTYYVSQSIYFCESPRKRVEVVVNPIPATPTGSDLQVFEHEPSSVVGDLVLDQNNIIWYSSEQDAATDTNRLAANMPLIDGNVYFGVLRSDAGCLSLPFAVTVKINKPLGVNDFDLTKLNYYPNPVKDVLTISYKETITRVEVYSLTGQRVLTMNASDYQVLVDMSRLAAATYVVKIYTDNQSQFVKIIKN
ncbi:fibronectin type III domain-containing protein [Flavobacterium sp. JP2137]|uniref:Ig-like domain-containing protein n=1 Tax=Flavobacterium sp. JP2137 TaxID=3414510 RepID=UPI003D2FBE20